MKTTDKQNEETNKILKGLEIAYKNLLKYKKEKNSDLVVLIDNEIVRVRPDQFVEFVKGKTK